MVLVSNKMKKSTLLLIAIFKLTSYVEAIGPLGSFGVGVVTPKCEPSLTTASGLYAIHKGNEFVFIIIRNLIQMAK